MIKFLLGVMALAVVLFVVGHTEGHYKPFKPTNMQISYCTPNGLSIEALQFPDAEQKYFARICSAYYLGAFQLSGWEPYIRTFLYYGKTYKLTIQDIDSDTWPNATTSEFLSQMQGASYVLVTMPEAERDIHLTMWSKMAQRYFDECAQAHQSVAPKNLLKLVRNVVDAR